MGDRISHVKTVNFYGELIFTDIDEIVVALNYEAYKILYSFIKSVYAFELRFKQFIANAIDIKWKQNGYVRGRRFFVSCAIKDKVGQYFQT